MEEKQGLDKMQSGKEQDKWVDQCEQKLGGEKMQGQVQAAEGAWEFLKGNRRKQLSERQALGTEWQGIQRGWADVHLQARGS